MNNLLKSPKFYGIIVTLGLSIGLAINYPMPILIILTIIGTVLIVNFVQNQANQRTVSQMAVIGDIMNKSKNGTKSPLEKYIEAQMTERIKEVDSGNYQQLDSGQPTVINMSADVPIEENSIF